MNRLPDRFSDGAEIDGIRLVHESAVSQRLYGVFP